MAEVPAAAAAAAEAAESSDSSSVSAPSSPDPTYGGLAFHSKHAKGGLLPGAQKEWRIALNAIEWRAAEVKAEKAVSKASSTHDRFRRFLNKRRKIFHPPARLLQIMNAGAVAADVAPAAVAPAAVAPADVAPAAVAASGTPAAVAASGTPTAAAASGTPAAVAPARPTGTTAIAAVAPRQSFTSASSCGPA